MRHPVRRASVRAALGGTLVLGLVASGPGVATHATSAAGEDTPAAADAVLVEGPLEPVSLTLITGDTVRLTEVGTGRRTVELEPGAGREQVGMHQLEIDGELHVLPLDALPHVAEGGLDQDLFNIDLLIDAGYDDDSTDTLPLIATSEDGAAVDSTGVLADLTGVSEGPLLESIGAHAVGVDKDGAVDFWIALTGMPADRAGDAPGGSGPVAFSSPVERIWLDVPVRSQLHESTAQIGAPTAWEAGIDGAGVTVAVLDTGVDADHPDLAGQVTLHEDFSGSGNTSDHVGHGTHVAATVAGTGTAADGARQGVAPGATILSGKVLDDGGNGATSGVIAGMEWAVAQDADIVNLSLGGEHTDGTDPLSQALNALAEESGTLFVVSAGNEGPGSGTVSSPGAADAALTVGAVDRDESLADFSSRGPRPGDLAVKPDLTAPGVGIVAARAQGTAMGTPVDDLYTASSGTSMAAPHVAGAAALVAAQHPDWDGQQLKDALVSTAAPHPDLSAYEQGSGRVDVARAVTQPLTATGTRHLGTFEDGDAEPAEVQITYANAGAEDLDLELDLDLATTGGEEPPGGSVSLSDDSVTVPADGTAQVSVAVEPALLERGQFTGAVRAQTGDTAVQTTVAVAKRAPTHEVTFRGVDMDGESSAVSTIVLLGENPEDDTLTFVREGETTTVTLPEGDVFLHAHLNARVDGIGASVVVTDPELEVTGEAEVVLDAREATQVQIETPRPATVRGNLGFVTRREFHGRDVANSTMKLPDVRSVWVTPTDAPAEGTFEFSSRWQLGAPVLTGTAEEDEELEILPEYERYSPVLEPDGPLELVAAGAGTPDDYDGLDVAGKMAVVTPAGKGQEDVAAAVDAGAAALLIAPEEQWYTVYTGIGERLDLPVVVLSPAAGQDLLDRLADGELRMSFAGSPDRPYTYDVVQVSEGQVPEEVVHTVTEENSATVTARYHEAGGDEWGKEQRFAWRPWQRNSPETQLELHTPQERTETVSAGDTEWRQHVVHSSTFDSLNPLTGGSSHGIRTYEPGEEVTYDWFRAVVRPAAPAGTPPVRTGDALHLRIAEHATGDGTLTQRGAQGHTSMSLWQDDELLHEDDAAWGEYPVGDGRVRLDLSVTRDQDPHWEFSTHTDTSWSFESRGVGAETDTVLPLLQVDYDVPVNLENRAAAGALVPVGLTVSHPEGADVPTGIRDASVWASYDDGGTWHPVPAIHAGLHRGAGEYTALVSHPDGEGQISLRVEATDVSGNSVEQTVLRAYGIGPQ